MAVAELGQDPTSGHCHTWVNVTDASGKVVGLKCYCGETYSFA